MKDFNFETLKLSELKEDKESLIKEAFELFDICNLKLDYEDVYNKLCSEINRVEYGVGTTEGRGYYDTNIYQILTVGGCKPGKLLKEIRPGKKIKKEYGFINEELTIVKSYLTRQPSTLCDVEIIKKCNDIQVGISINVTDDELWMIDRIQVDQYNGNKLINSRVVSIYDLDEEDDNAELTPRFYDKEWYFYSGDCLMGCIHLDLAMEIDLITKIKIDFLCDEEGCPVKFIMDGRYDQVNDIKRVNQKYYRERFLNKD